MKRFSLLIVVILFLPCFSYAQAPTQVFKIDLAYINGTTEISDAYPSLGTFNDSVYTPDPDTYGEELELNVQAFNGSILYQRGVEIPLYAMDVGVLNKSYFELHIPYKESAKEIGIIKNGVVIDKVDVSEYASEESQRSYDEETYRLQNAEISVTKSIAEDDIKEGEKVKVTIEVENKNNYAVNGKLHDSNPHFKPPDKEINLKIPPSSIENRSYKIKAHREYDREVSSLGKAFFLYGDRAFYSGAPEVNIRQREEKSGKEESEKSRGGKISLVVLAACLVCGAIALYLVKKKGHNSYL